MFPDSEATGEVEDGSSSNNIRLISRKVHSATQLSKDGPFFTSTVMVNNGPISLVIDSGSPVTLVPNKTLKDSRQYVLYKQNTDA